MKITIFGTGCPKCIMLENLAKQAVAELNLAEATVEHEYDIERIIEEGIMSTPALKIDGSIMCAGRLPSLDELKNWLKN